MRIRFYARSESPELATVEDIPLIYPVKFKIKY